MNRASAQYKSRANEDKCKIHLLSGASSDSYETNLSCINVLNEVIQFFVYI